MQDPIESRVPRRVHWWALLLGSSLLLGGATLAAAQDAQPGAAPPVGAAGPAAASRSGPVTILIQITVKQERLQDYLKLMGQMKARVQHEDHGNLHYDLFAVAPGPGRPNTHLDYVFFEQWRDQEAAAAHRKWASPIVRNVWPTMTDSLRLNLLTGVLLSE